MTTGAIGRLRVDGPKNQVIAHGDTLYLRGMVAERRINSMSSQTEQILAKVEKCLQAAGSSKERILQATVYLSDMSRKEEMNAVWAAWMPPEHEPARVTVGVELSSPETLIEIIVVAAR